MSPGPSFGDVVLKALEEQRRTKSSSSSSSSPPVSPTSTSSRPLPTFNLPTTDTPDSLTPPASTTPSQSPKLKAHSKSNSGGSSSTARGRPRHRSQASFDWFANPTSSPSPLGNGHARVAEEEEEDRTRGVPGQEGHKRDSDEVFKGAFTNDDFQRGATLMRKQSIPPAEEKPDDKGKGKARNKPRSSSLDSPAIRWGTNKGKARSGEGSEWEDADDAVGELGSPRIGAGKDVRKGSLWTLAGLPGSGKRSGGESGTSTPDHASVAGDGTTTPKRPKPPPRRATTGWTAIRNKIKVDKAQKKNLNKSLSGHELITELTTGVLPNVMIKMAYDRDEKGDHRIPILMNYLKLRITDSIYPFHDRHAVFRIELEYGDGLVKWVIYRELADFVNLHAKYRVSNLRHRIDKFPTFPKTSIPYLQWLKSEGKRGTVGKAEFTKGQRDALERYLLQLIRATMFGPSANRLCKFLEISAMSIALVSSGGVQGKQGYLRIMSGGASRKKEQGFHPFSWKDRHGPKWFLVRDSYIVAVKDPASTEIYEVFMIDSTFEIERPSRVYRKGINLFRGSDNPDSDDEPVDHSQPQELKAEPSPTGVNGAGDPLDPTTTHSTPKDLRDSSNHTFYLKSSERKLRLVAKTERQQDQFIASIEKMVAKTIWAGKNRFESFAPIRMNVAAQWLVDGRDYFWSVSRAIMLAKSKIYIHDWWLSPELYLRRPTAGNQKWRLDKLLQRKARQGVQIFVIVYKEVSNDFTPVDSNWTKTSLRALHPNIHIQRSPSHTSTGTLLWSHHEKMCVVDETIGFMGGLDLCFGRWDTPGHVLVDDGTEEGEIPISAEKLKGREGSYIWPGKDYANQRVVDFHTLNKPDEDMYDRTQVPRQPWHDVGLQIIGQPARDLCRHFIQRWNHLLRIKNHTVHMPFLLPPPEFTAKELEDKRITGTCEVQICRSVGPWSMGISHVEHSIQNAYIKAIQLSDHFVYIENQFFISSTRVEGVEIENKIGDALVSRIIKAHTEGTPWRAVIIIPLVPGYPYPIDHGDAGSVRLIMECQNRTINRGDHSIFAKLRRNGIDPDEYISFYGLRGWGKLASGALTTEAVYIHDKMMVVDDRIAIIGSANINERSQRGDRDSELACIIRDTDMIDSTMGGKPYQVGRFAHTLRIRLMREHLGIDVDALEAEDDDADLLSREPDQPKSDHESWDPDNEQAVGDDAATKKGATTGWINRISVSAKENVENVISGATQSAAIGMEKGERKVGDDVANAFDRTKGTESKDAEKSDASDASKVAAGEKKEEFAASTEVPTLEEKVMAEQRPSEESRTADELPNRSQGEEHTRDESFDDVQKDKLGHQTTQHNPKADDTRKPMGQQGAHGKDGATDDRQDIARLSPITEQSNPASPQQSKPASPHLSDSDPSEATASSRQLEKPLNPEATESSASLSSSVPASGDPRSSTTHGKDSSRHRSSTVGRNAINASLRRNLRDKNAYTLPVPAANIDPNGFSDPLVDSFYKDVWLASAVRNTQAFRKVFRCVPDDLVQTWKQYREFQTWAERHNKAPKDVVPPGDDPPHTDPEHHSGQHGAGGGGTGAGVMGQGVRDEAPPVETMHRANSRSTRNRSNSTAVPPSDGRRVPSSASGPAAGEGHDHDEGFPAHEREMMEELLNDIRGTLVIYPTRFLEAESAGGNFLFSKDRLPPLAIYD